jgi:S-adenosylmethionine hydrolase
MSDQGEMKLVTLLTDFGTADGYVGAMKGVLLRNVPDVQIIDISHEIAAFSYRQAAFALLNYAFEYPPNTVHIVVIDPGVGSQRSGLVVETTDHYYIGPDNGVFSFVYLRQAFNAYEIMLSELKSNISSTFHGRDVFAPVAVRILSGEAITNFCQPAQHLSSFYTPYEKLDEKQIRLKVLHIDRFGNLIFNFTRAEWQELGQPENVQVRINHSLLSGIKETFGDVKNQELLLMWDSQDFLQIAQNKGNAAKILCLQEGDCINLKLP